MKKLTVILAMGLALFAAVLARAQNVAVVDLETLVRLHPDTADNKQQLEQTLAKYKREGMALQQELETLNDEFERARKEASDPASSDKIRKDAEDRAVKAREAYANAERAAHDRMQLRQRDLQDMEGDMLRRTTDKIRLVVEAYAAEKKIDMALPANQVFYFHKTLDITDAIMKRMNIQRPTPEAARSVAVVTNIEAGVKSGDVVAPKAAGVTTPTTGSNPQK